MTQFTQSAVVSAVLLTLFGCNQTQPTTLQAPNNPRPIQVVEVREDNTPRMKSFSGVIQANETAALSFRVPGTVETVLVKKGDVVEKGHVIATLDAHDYQVSLDELHARMLEAKSAHKLAKAELKRVKQATQDDAIASVNLDRAVSGYERSLSAVNVMQMNIQRAEDALKYTTLRAPFAGVIGDVNIDPFEQTIPGISVVSLQANNQLDVDIDVPENLIQQFALGQSASLTWYDAKRPYPATVSEIAPTKHLIKQTYTVTLRIDSLSPALFSGKSVTVSTQFNANSSHYCFPYSSILGEKETLHVNVVRDAVVRIEPVVLNSLDAHQACVTGQFAKGDYVVVSGSHFLNAGDNAPNLSIKML